METPRKLIQCPSPLLRTPVMRLFSPLGEILDTPKRCATSGTPRGSALMETPIAAHLIASPRRRSVTGTPRRALIKQTEHVIEQYLQDDCETNLPMIRTLEDISYQLWVESNTAFLDESVVSELNESDAWQWDDDCFYDTLDSVSATTPQKQARHVVDDADSDGGRTNTSLSSCSSLGSSIKPCDETDCYLGYLACTEWEMSDVSTTESEIEGVTGDLLDDWIIVSDEIHQDTAPDTYDSRDWVVLSTSSPSKPINIKVINTIEETQGRSSKPKELFTSSLKDLENASDSVNAEDKLDEDDDEWAVLSVKVTEFRIRGKRIHHEQLLDSGIQSRDTSCATSVINSSNNVPVPSMQSSVRREVIRSPDSSCDTSLRSCSHNSTASSVTSGAMCLRALIRSFVEHVLPFLFPASSGKGTGHSCECCSYGKITALDVLQGILTELNRR